VYTTRMRISSKGNWISIVTMSEILIKKVLSQDIPICPKGSIPISLNLVTSIDNDFG
jgi:hypothetical protein